MWNHCVYVQTHFEFLTGCQNGILWFVNGYIDHVLFRVISIQMLMSMRYLQIIFKRRHVCFIGSYSLGGVVGEHRSRCGMSRVRSPTGPNQGLNRVITSLSITINIYILIVYASFLLGRHTKLCTFHDFQLTDVQYDLLGYHY